LLPLDSREYEHVLSTIGRRRNAGERGQTERIFLAGTLDPLILKTR
jgi:hypothetical protein